MIGILGLLISVIAVILLTWKNWHMTIVALVGSSIIVFFNHMDLVDTLSEHFLPALSSFAGTWFLQFILGSILGKIMEESRASFGIANSLLKVFGKKSVILIIMLAGLILSYCGIGTFTIAFSIYPIAAALFRNANYSKSLIVATIMVCPVTICMAMLPGSPSAQNLIPTHFFGTSIYSGPRIGIICSILMFVASYLYLNIQARKYQKHGHYFEALDDNQIQSLDTITSDNLPPLWACYMPIIVVLVVIPFLQFIFHIPSSYAVAGAMVSAIVVGIILFRDYINIRDNVNKGSVSGIVALIATASIMGFGAVASASPAYQSITTMLTDANSNPVFSAVISINVIAAITGSSAGGLNIYLSNMGNYLAASNLNLSMLHRVTCIASSGFDAMPHASGIVLCNQIAKTSQKDTYIHVFITCAIMPFCCAVLAAVLGLWGIV